MDKIICFLIHHKPVLIYRDNKLCHNMDKKTIMIWIICSRCMKQLNFMEFNNKEVDGYYTQLKVNLGA